MLWNMFCRVCTVGVSSIARFSSLVCTVCMYSKMKYTIVYIRKYSIVCKVRHVEQNMYGGFSKGYHEQYSMHGSVCAACTVMCAQYSASSIECKV